MRHRFPFVYLTLLLGLSLCSGPATAGADLSEAKLLIDDGWMDDAEVLLLDLSKSNPKDPEIYYQLARVYLIRDDAQSGNGGAPWKNLDRIEEYAKKAIELDPDDARYYVVYGHGVGLKAMRGGTVKKFSRAKSAKKAYETAAELDPGNVEARTSLIEYHMQAPGVVGGDKDEARRLAGGVAEIDSADGFYAWKSVYLHEKDYDSLELAIRRVVEERPSEREGYAEYAQLCRRRGDYECSVTNLEKVLIIDPSDLDAYWYLYYSFAKMEEYGDAEATLTKAMETAPDKAHVYRWLGDFYREHERWNDAIAMYQEGLEVDPEYVRMLYQMGATYVLMEQNLDLANDYFTRYLSSRLNCWWPDRALAHCQLAKIYILQDNKKMAVKEIKKAKKLNPNNDEIQRVAKELRIR